MIMEVETVLSGQQGNTEGLDSGSSNTEVTETEVVDQVVEGTQESETTEAEDTEKTAESEDEKTPIEYDVKAPEGLDIDAEVMAGLTPVFNELGIDNDGAQKLLDAYAPYMQTMMTDAIEKGRSEFASKQASELEALKSDPEFGGKNWEENRQAAQMAVKQFSDPEMVQFLNDTGLGNSPQMIRMFAKIGKSIGNDNLIVEGSDAGQKFSASTLYKNSKMNP
jgi:hypothetical protein